MLPLLLAAISIQTNFEGASLGRIERIAENHFRCAVLGERDENNRNRQASWYFFRVDGAAGREVTIDLIDLPGEYNFKPNRGAIDGNAPAWISEDQKHWQPSAVEYDRASPSLRIRLRPRSNRHWVAHVPPYTNAKLDQLLREVRGQSGWNIRSIGRTPEGRPIRAMSIGSGSRSIWLMFRQHSWEAGSSWAAEGAIRYLTLPGAEALRQSATFVILPMCDPDGVARGGVRFNARGYDLNRNWDIATRERTPEIFAQLGFVREWLKQGRRIDLFISLHNTETAEYLDGPEGAIRDRLFQALSASLRFSASRPPSAQAAESAKGRMTAAQAMTRLHDVPGFLIEQRIGMHPKLGRFPEPADRLAFGADLVKAAFDAGAR